MLRTVLLAVLVTALGLLAGTAHAQAPALACTGTETVLNPSFMGTRPLDDGSFEVSLAPVFTTAAPLRIAGMSYTTMFVNINGNVTFGVPFETFTPRAVPGLTQPTIAPFFADVDLRNRVTPATTNPGVVRYCVEPALNRVMVTWENTVHYDSTAATTDYSRQNTFQLILEPALVCGTDGVIATFRHEALSWYVGTASGGLPNGTCAPGTIGTTCTPAVAGVDYGDTVTASQLPGSLTATVSMDLMTMTNTGTPGVWRTEINPTSIPSCGNGTIDGTCEDCDDRGESATCDADCTSVRCGDGTLNVSAGETCDEGGETVGCDVDCTPSACGDGTLNPTASEECDDGNTVDGDGCSATCLGEACGNGRVDFSEACDDGGESATCNDNCSVAACGDTILNGTAGEECDDGNTTAADGCSDTCLIEMCGNGRVDAGESCDGAGEAATCDDDCTDVECGDGIRNVTAGEPCDDGNVVDGDGCSSTCTLEACGNGAVDVGEDCDEGGETATCDADCTSALCGDSVVNAAAGEMCDGGGDSATCDADCTPVMCGDGALNMAAGEGCDDGNLVDGDGCSSTCTTEMVMTDAGSPGSDAGVPFPDSGADSADGGEGSADAGDDFGLAGGACGCRVGGDAPAGAPLGLLVLGLLALVRRRGNR